MDVEFLLTLLLRQMAPESSLQTTNINNWNNNKSSQVSQSSHRWPTDCHCLPLPFPLQPIMNLYNEGDPSNLLFVNFNQDASSLAVGTKQGYKLFTFTNPEQLEQVHEYRGEEICVVERLFSSSLVALVSLSSPRKLKVCHYKKTIDICNEAFASSILAVKLNRQRLVVCLEESLHIFNIRDMKMIHVIRETPPNSLGLCALSSNSENGFLAYPGHNTAGEVQIFDTDNLVNKITFAAHDNPLAALAFDPQGTLLATASEKGTVIRVHDVLTGNCSHEFRRGYARCVNIFSLCFSSDSMFLSASSNTETVHIFKLEEPSENKQGPEGSSWYDSIKDTVVQMGSLLPSVNQVMSQWRCFAHAKLPFSGLKNVCALSTDKNGHVPRLLVASADGFFYIYDVNTSEGGECTLIKQHKLDDTDSGGDMEGAFAPSSVTLNYAAAVRGDRDIHPRPMTSTPPPPPPSPSPAAKSDDDGTFDGDFPPMNA